MLRIDTKIAIFSLLYVFVGKIFSALVENRFGQCIFRNLEDNAFRVTDFLQNRSDNNFVLISCMIGGMPLYLF